MILFILPTTDVQAANNSKKANKAYRTWLTRNAPSKYKKYAVTDMNGDGISELVGRYKRGETTHIIICSYNGKKVVTKQFQEAVTTSGGYRASLQYIPGKGTIRYSTGYAGSGEFQDKIYQLKKGKLKKVASGTIKYSVHGANCKWRGKKVSESTYNNNLNKLFNSSSAKSLNKLKYISKAKLKNKLK